MGLISEIKNVANDVAPMIRICSSVYLQMKFWSDDKSQVSYINLGFLQGRRQFWWKT